MAVSDRKDNFVYKGVEFSHKNNEGFMELYKLGDITYEDFRQIVYNANRANVLRTIEAYEQNRALGIQKEVPSKKLAKLLRKHLDRLVNEELIHDYKNNYDLIYKFSSKYADKILSMSILTQLCEFIESDPFIDKWDSGIVLSPIVGTTTTVAHANYHQKEHIKKIRVKKRELEELNRFNPTTLFLIWWVSPSWRPYIRYYLRQYRGIVLPEEMDLIVTTRVHAVIEGFRRNLFDYDRFKILFEWTRFYQNIRPLSKSWFKGEPYTSWTWVNKEKVESSVVATPAERDRFTNLISRFIDDEVLGNFEKSAWQVERLAEIHLTGSKFLLFACRYIENNKIKKTKLNKRYGKDRPDEAIFKMLTTCRPIDSEDKDEIIAELKKFKPETQLFCGCLAYHWRTYFEKSMEMEGFSELMNFLYGMATRIPPEEPDAPWAGYFLSYSYENPFMIDYSGDIESGYIDRQRILAPAETLGKENISKIFKVFDKQIKLGRPDTIMLVKAALGLNKKEVLEKFEKRNQTAVKAYGALPGTKDIAKRYKELKKFQEEAKQFGVQRSSHERVASKVALRNLAQTAGYKDEIRLEWALGINADEINELTSLSFKKGEYDCTVAIEDSKPVFRVEKSGKKLSSIPKPVKDTPQYKKYKEVARTVRKFARRYKSIFEETMISGEWVNKEELKALKNDPVAVQLLSRVIIADDKDYIGPLDFSKLPNKARILHPYEMIERASLIKTQDYIIDNKVKQPFKQAFRELYVLTPAEQTTPNISNRFDYIIVNCNKVAALLGPRGWICRHKEPVIKYFPGGLRATIDSKKLWFDFYAEMDIGGIYFEKKVKSTYKMIPLKDVNPIIYSETMRDVELIVSRAFTGEWYELSDEILEYRANLIKKILKSMNLKQVTIVDNKAAIIQGKLTVYIVLLKNGRVYFENKRYFCMVPAEFIRHKRIFLPFEEDDFQTAEIISKILLLANDDKIKDESIMNQIQWYLQGNTRHLTPGDSVDI